MVSIIKDIINRGLEGAFNKYYSKYRGFVVDRDDPSGFGRLKLIIPNVTGDNILNYWAWPNNFAGDGYGCQILPKVGDMVWVEFEFGNPRRPLWTHGYHGRNEDNNIEKPEELRDPDNYWFKTPGGHLIEFDDTNKHIRITSISGKIIEVSEDGKIHLGKADGADEAAALGDTLKAKLDSLFDILIGAKTMTALGPQPFMPNDLLALQNLKNELGQIISNTITLDK